MVQQLDHDSFMAQRLLLHERIQRGEENCRATATNELICSLAVPNMDVLKYNKSNKLH